MRVELLQPDAAPSAQPVAANPTLFAQALDALGTVLNRAENSEDAYASGNASLQDAVYDRASADVALSIATTAAARTAQALQSILNMQI